MRSRHASRRRASVNHGDVKAAAMAEERIAARIDGAETGTVTVVPLRLV